MYYMALYITYYLDTTHFSMIKIPIKPIVIKTILHYLPLFFRHLTYVVCNCFNNKIVIN